MAGEIVVPCRLWLQRTNNAAATWDQMTAATNAHQAEGFLMPNASAADVNFKAAQAVPTNVNGTPGGKIQIHWVTTSADTSSTVKFSVAVKDIVLNTTSVDAAADETLTVTDASNGQYVENSCEVSLSATGVTSGVMIRGTITRDPADGSDTLAADVYITGVYLIANI